MKSRILNKRNENILYFHTKKGYSYLWFWQINQNEKTGRYYNHGGNQTWSNRSPITKNDFKGDWIKLSEKAVKEMFPQAFT